MKRRLSDADRQAWEAYRKTANPLERRPLSAPQRNKVEFPPPEKTPVSSSVPQFRMGQRARCGPSIIDTAPSLTDSLKETAIAMDRKTWQRLRAGKLRPQAKLDLHGMTLDTAHPALLNFILTNHTKGNRLLLVVTGKGKRKEDEGPIPTRLGILRHQVPQWLRMPPIGPLILQILQAHQIHGGIGAYYVYLRRNR